MGNDERQEWVVVAEFTAIDMGVAADLAVSKLQGSGIPAQRMPTGSIAGAFGTGMLASELIRIIVPPEHEERAREILAEGWQNSDVEEQGDER